MKGGLDEVIRLKRMHARWMGCQFVLGTLPIFCLINQFQPMLTDGYGHDLIPSLLPVFMSRHYHLLIAISLVTLALSEILRRRFHSRHQQDLAL